MFIARVRFESGSVSILNLHLINICLFGIFETCHAISVKNRLIIFEEFPISRIFPVDLYPPTVYET